MSEKQIAELIGWEWSHGDDLGWYLGYGKGFQREDPSVTQQLQWLRAQGAHVFCSDPTDNHCEGDLTGSPVQLEITFVRKAGHRVWGETLEAAIEAAIRAVAGDQ